MENFIKAVLDMLRDFFVSCSKPLEVNDREECDCAKGWLKRTCILYAVFSVFAFFEIILFFALYRLLDLPQMLIYILGVLMPALLLLTNWGYATLISYLPSIVKSVIEWVKGGYNVGKNFETTHVQVTHEYGNRYNVSSYTENKGCLFAVVAGVLRLFIWAFFCVYIGPFLTFKKITGSIKNIKGYQAS